MVGRRVRSIRRDVAVRCLDCDTEYTATETVHEQYSDESFIGQHVDPLIGGLLMRETRSDCASGEPNLWSNLSVFSAIE
jgi:hypothetical protein